jgi:hypothetical protein
VIIKEEETQELIENLYSMIGKLSDRVYDLEHSKPITVNLNKDQQSKVKEGILNKFIDIYDAKFDEWNKEFDIPKKSAEELLRDIVQGEIKIPNERLDEVKGFLDNYVKVWDMVVRGMDND